VLPAVGNKRELWGHRLIGLKDQILLLKKLPANPLIMFWEQKNGFEERTSTECAPSSESYACLKKKEKAGF